MPAYSALKIYEKYEKQKLLVDTDLDLARALSNEQPSLQGFAFNLVAAGLEGFALFRLWRKAVELRKLALERQTLREAIDEFRAIMNEHRRQADTDRFSMRCSRARPRPGGGKPPASRRRRQGEPCRTRSPRAARTAEAEPRRLPRGSRP